MIAGFQKGKEAREQERAGKREVDFFFFWLWDADSLVAASSSSTRDQTQAPCIGSTES